MNHNISKNILAEGTDNSSVIYIEPYALDQVKRDDVLFDEPNNVQHIADEFELPNGIVIEVSRQ